MSSLLYFVLGCTTNPGTKNKYCSEHKHLQQPCISSNSLNSKSLKLLTKSNNQKTTTIGDDTVFIIEGVLDSENRTDGRYLHVKWESYSITTW